MKKITLFFALLAIATMATAQVRVLSNGNTGIGITNPTQRLHVVGNSYLNGNVGIATASPTQRLHVVGNTYLNGSLGIGVASPTYKLHVSGSAFIGTTGTNNFGGLTIDYVAVGAFPPGSGPTTVFTTLCGVVNNTLNLGTTSLRIKDIFTYNINSLNPLVISDMRLKENIRPSSSVLNRLKAVRVYNYNYTDEMFRDFIPEQKARAQKTEYGFLAQELQEIFPELVFEDDSTGMLSFKYVGMIPILTSAINELQQEKETQQTSIEELRREVEALKNALRACCNANSTNSPKAGGSENSLEFELTDPVNTNTEDMKLYQNAPNPFNVTTTIHCYIPQTVKKVELCIYNMQGVQVKCLPLSERGTVNVQIQAGQLSAGIYSYFLIGDGKTSDAKQRILTK